MASSVAGYCSSSDTLSAAQFWNALHRRGHALIANLGYTLDGLRLSRLHTFAGHLARTSVPDLSMLIRTRCLSWWRREQARYRSKFDGLHPERFKFWRWESQMTAFTEIRTCRMMGLILVGWPWRKTKPSGKKAWEYWYLLARNDEFEFPCKTVLLKHRSGKGVIMRGSPPPSDMGTCRGSLAPTTCPMMKKSTPAGILDKRSYLGIRAFRMLFMQCRGRHCRLAGSETDSEGQWSFRLLTNFRARLSRRILCVFQGTRSETWASSVPLDGGMRAVESHPIP